MNKELIEALRQIEREKKIDAGTILEALEAALAAIYKKNYEKEDRDIEVNIDPESGELSVFELEEDENGNITKAKQEIVSGDFGRLAAQTAKQVILQRIREVEREMMFDEYAGREGDIVTGIVQQSDSRYTLVNLGRVEALLPAAEQVPSERYDHGMRLKAYIVEVRRTTKDPQIIVSRSHPGLLRRLFELEVPEIYDGFVEIKSVAREPGYRSKIAVTSLESGVDPVGACVGPKGSRVRMVVSELRGEKIDVVQYNDDMKVYVANALAPAKVKEVVINEEAKTATVIVPDSQLSLAIGKEGQNARLAAKLTGWRIDIKSETQLAEELLSGVAESEKAEAETEDRCAAIKSDGTRCTHKALAGSRYCGLAAHKKQGEVA
jgi:N utilization substance protein A